MEYNNSIQTQGTEEWSEQDEKNLQKAQDKYKRGKRTLYDITYGGNDVDNRQEAEIAIHKPYDQMTQQERDELAIKRLDFFMANAGQGGMNPDTQITTLEDIYKTGYLDVWMKPEYRYDPANMPDMDVLEQRRWEMNKEDNMSKMWKTFFKTTVDGFVKSAASWKYMFNHDAYQPERDYTGTFWEVLANGYTPMVTDPSKKDKKFTKEYWMNQFAQMGTSIGMVGEMVLEGLLLHGLGELTGINAGLDMLKTRFASKLTNVEKLKAGMELSRNAAARGEATEAMRLMNEAKMASGAVTVENIASFTHDVFEGTFVAMKNATLNYQFNVNEEYNRQMNIGTVSEEEAIKNAHKAAWNTFCIEIVGSALINISQSRLINGINRQKWNNFTRSINVAAAAERAGAAEIAHLSTKGLMAKNIGRFIASQAQEGLEEVWEDGMALYGRQQAYLDDKEKWDRLGLTYYMAKDTHTLIDSFIGGVMGGTIISGARLGFNAVTGNSSYKMQKRQIELYNTMVDNFKKNIDAATFSYIKEQKQLDQLDDDYNNKRDIETTDAQGNIVKVKAGDSNYRDAYNNKRAEISDTHENTLELYQAIINATTAIQIVQGAPDGNVSSAVTENINAIQDKIAAINTLLKKEYSDDQLVEMTEEKKLEDEIEKLETAGQDSSEAKKKLDDLHTKWIKNGETDEMAKLRKMFEFMDVFKDGKMQIPSEETLNKELNNANQQLLITNAFNNAFYNYFTGVKTDVGTALRFATNEAYLYMSQMTNRNDVDGILAIIEPMLNSLIESNEKIFGSGANEKPKKVAYAYSFFSKLNKDGKYDNIIQLLVSYMAQDSGYAVKRDSNGRIPLDFSESRISSADTDDLPKDYLTSFHTYHMYRTFIKEADTVLGGVKNMDTLDKLVDARDKVSLIQSIFTDNDADLKFKGLKEYITAKQYKVIERLLKRGTYSELRNYVNKLEKEMKSGKKTSGRKFSAFVENNKAELQDLADMKNEIDNLEKQFSYEAIVNKMYDDSKIETKLSEKKEELDTAIKEGREQAEIDNIEKDIKELEDKKSVFDLVRSAVKNERDFADIEAALIEADKKIHDATPEYNRRIAIEDHKRSILNRVIELENDIANNFDEDNVESDMTQIDKIVTEYLVQYYGLKKGKDGNVKVTQAFIKSLPIEAEKKKALCEKLKEGKGSNDYAFYVKLDAAKALMQPVDVIMSEDEQKAFDEARKDAAAFDMLDEVRKLNDDVNKKYTDMQVEISDKRDEYDSRMDKLKGIEVSMVWGDENGSPKLRALGEYLATLKKKYPALQKTSSKDAEKNVSMNAFAEISDYESFFKTGKDITSMMFIDAINAARSARKHIEYMNAVGEENNALLTDSGRKTYMFKSQLREICDMPENDSKEVFAKYMAITSLAKNALGHRALTRKSKRDKSLDFTINEILSRQRVIENVYRTFNYEAERKRKAQREAKMEDMRNEIRSELEKTLTKKEMRKFRNVELSDINEVKRVLNELNELATDERKEEIAKVLASMDKFVRQNNEQKLSDIMEEEAVTEETKQAAQQQAPTITFSLEQAKPNTIYYLNDAKGNNKTAAEQYASNNNFEALGIDSDKFIFDEAAQILVVTEKDGKKIYTTYDTQFKEIHSADSFDLEDDQTSIPQAPTQSSEEDVIELDDSDAFTNIGNSIEQHFNKGKNKKDEDNEENDDDNIVYEENGEDEEVSLPQSTGKRSEVIRHLLHCANEFASAGVSASDWNVQVTDTTDMKPFITHVMEQLGLNKEQADTYIYMLSEIAGHSLNAIAMKVYRATANPGTGNYNAMSYGRLIKELGRIEASRLYGMKEKDFDEMADYIYVQSLPAQSGNNGKPEKKKMDKTTRDYVDVYGSLVKNRARYSGNHALLVHQNFDDVKNVAKVKENGEIEEARVYRVPRYVDSEGNSIVGKEGIKRLNSMNGNDPIYIETDVEAIYNFNIGLMKSSGDFTEFNDNDYVKGLKGKKWSKLSKEQKDNVREDIAHNAIIRIFADKEHKVCIGFLPNKGYFSLYNVQVPMEGRGTDDERVTADAITATKEKINVLNSKLGEIRNNIALGKEINYEITQSKVDYGTQNGELIEDATPANASMFVGSDSIYVEQNGKILEKKIGEKRRAQVVFPGITGISVKEDTRSYSITTIADDNMDQDAFRLSKTLPNVHFDTKVKLCSLLVSLVADLYRKGDKQSAQGIVAQNKDLFNEIYPGLESALNGGNNIVLETIVSAKDFLGNKDTKFYVKNSGKTGKELFDPKWTSQSMQCSRFSIGGLTDNKDGYFSDTYKGGFRIFLGNSDDANLTDVLAIEFDKIKADDINKLITMLFGATGDRSVKNLDEKLDSLTISVSQIGKKTGYKDFETIKLYSIENQNGLHPNLWEQPATTTFLSEIEGKILVQGDQFHFVTKYDSGKKYDKMESVQMESHQVNIGFGIEVEDTTGIVTDYTGTDGQNTGTDNGQPINGNEGQEQQTQNVIIQEVTPGELEESGTPLTGNTDNGEEINSNLSYIKRPWMYSENDMYEIAKTIFARVIDRIQHPNNSTEIAKEISDITRNDIGKASADYLNAMVLSDIAFSKVIYRILKDEFAKETYSDAIALANAVLIKYPYLEQKRLIENCQKWIDGELKFDAGLTDKALAKGLFWQKIFNPEMFDIMFGRKDSYFNTYIANVFGEDEHITLEDETAAENEDSSEVNDITERVRWDYEQDNTTPLVSTISERVRILLSTIRKRKAQTDAAGSIITDIDGNLETEYDYTSQAGKDFSLYEIYDLADVLNFLREMGTRNIKPTWMAYMAEIRKVAEGKSNMAPLAISILDAFEHIADERVITEIKYKMGTKAKCRFRYLSINEITSYDQNIKYTKETHISLLNSRIENPNALFAQLTTNVRNGFDTDIIIRHDIKIGERKSNQIATTTEKNGNTIYTDDYRTFIKFFTCDKITFDRTFKGTSFSNSWNLRALFANFLSGGRWNEIAIKNNMPEFNLAMKELADFLFDVYGWRFDYDSLYQAGWNNIDGILKNIYQSVQKGKAYEMQTDRQQVKSVIPSIMMFKDSKNLFNLLKLEVRNNNLFDDIVVRSGGKNVQTITDRSFADWQVMELQDKNSEIRDHIIRKNTDDKGRSWHPLLSRQHDGSYHCEDDDFYHGLFDISVCRYKGEFSGKITELNDADQMFVRSLMYFDTAGMNYERDIFSADTWGITTNVQSFRYATVSDLTDSNKTKSGYWRLPCIIPQIDKETGNIENSKELFYYVLNSLFVSETRRIMDVLRNHDRKNGELLFLSNMTYNNMVIEAKDRAGNERKWTMAQYLMSDVSDDEKIHFLEQFQNLRYGRRNISRSGDAKYVQLESTVIDTTVNIINDMLTDITGVSLSVDEYDKFSFKISNTDAAKSSWAKCGILNMNQNGVPMYGRFRVNDDNNSYTKNINKLSRTDANTLVNGNPKMCYMQAAVDFVVNNLVNSHFILNTMYGGGLNYIENDLNKDGGFDSKMMNVTGENEMGNASSMVEKMAAKLVDRVYKRMAGVMTGGNVSDFSICYKDDKSEDAINNPWGGPDHMEFLYMNCASAVGSYSADFAFYVELYFPEEAKKKEVKELLDTINDPNSRKELKERFPSLSEYLSIDATDGQEFCSWREAIDTMLSKSAISRKEYNDLKRIYSGWPKSMKAEDDKKAREILRKGMQVFKPVYFGAKIDDNDTRMSVDYVKTSMCPLFPNFSYSMRYDAIRQAIEAVETATHRNVHFAFDSGIKVGGSVKNQLTIAEVEDMARNGKMDVDRLQDACFKANRKYFYIQNETDTKIQTKLDKKNKEKRNFDEKEVVSKLDVGKDNETGEDFYNISFCLSSIEEALGVDFSNKYLAGALVRTLADIIKGKFMTKEQYNNQTKEIQNEARKKAEEYLNSFVFDENGETKQDYIEDLSVELYQKNVKGFKAGNLRSLLLKVNNSMLYRAAYYDIAADTPKEQRAERRNEKVNQLMKLPFDKQYKYIKDIFAKQNINETPVNYKEVDSFIEDFTKKGGVYSKALGNEEKLDRMYYDMSENVEMKTVELTQLEHMITSGGISKINRAMFEIPADVISDDMRSIIGGEFIDKWKKNKKGNYVVNGKTLELIRNTFEITESFNNMLNLLYDKENGFGIISKKQKADFEATKQIPDLRTVLSNKQIMRALKRRILHELQSRDAGTNAADLIRLDVPLIMNSSLRQIEYLLMSLIKKNISRTYLTGSSYFLMSPKGFEQNTLHKLNDTEDVNLESLEGVIWLDRKRGTGPLRTAHKTNNGKDELVMAECAIAPYFTYFDTHDGKYKVIDFYTTDNNGKYLYLVDREGNAIKKSGKMPSEVYINEKMVNEDVLKIISLRVPTSGLMNSCALKVVAFLPTNMGATIVVPQEHIAQFGEDFDIDKRFCYIRNWIVKDGKIDILKNKDIENFKTIFDRKYKNDKRYTSVISSMTNKMRANRLIDIYMAVLGNPDNEVQKKINVVLNWDKLKETRERIVKNAPSNVSANGVIRNTGDIRTQIDIGVKSSSGLRGTGAWSNKVVFSAILSKVEDDNGRGVLMKEEGLNVNVVLAWKNEPGNSLTFNGDLSSPDTISVRGVPSRTKMEVDAAQQNINLDTVKEDIIAWINQNTETLQFFEMMSFMGYDQTDEIIFRKILRDENGNIRISRENDGKGTLDIASLVAVQPLIRMLTQLEAHRKTILKNYDTNKEIMEQLLSELGLDKSVISKLEENDKFDDESLKELGLKDFRIDENGMLIKRYENTGTVVRHYFGNINGQNLYQNMYLKPEQIINDEKHTFLKHQFDCLAFFMYVRRKGYELQKFRNLLTVNSKGIGKEYLSVQDKIRALNDMGKAKDSSFINIEKTIGEFIPKTSDDDFAPEGFYNIHGCNYFIKPTTAEGNNLIMSLIAANSIVGTSIGYTNKSLSNMFDKLDKVFRDRNYYQEKRDKFKRRAVHDTQIYLMLMLDDICKAHGQEGIFRKYDGITGNFALQYERVRLIKEEYKKLKETKTILKKYDIDDTFFRVVETIMKAKPRFVSDRFLSHFSQKANGTLVFNIKANETYDRLTFTNALLEMWNSDKRVPVQDSEGNFPYTNREFVKDIVALAFIMDDQQGMNNFKNLIPVEILKETGMIDAMKTLGTLIENDKIDFDNMFTQLMANNPELLPKNNKIKIGPNPTIEISADIKTLKNTGLYNPNYRADDLSSSPFIDMFRVESKKYIMICEFDHFDTERNKVVYKKRIIDRREGSGRNAYNPFIDFFDDQRLNTATIEEAETQKRMNKKFVMERAKMAENLISKLTTIIGNENDAFVNLFEKVFESNIFDGLEITANAVDSILDKNGANTGANAQVKRQKGTMKMEIEYTNAAVGNPHIIHEEMMHCLLSSYLEDKFDRNGNIVDKSISDRFKVSLDIYNKLHDFYNKRRRDGEYDPNNGYSQLANIFQGRGAKMSSGFNEFLANIMSCDQNLIDLINDYQNENGEYVSQYDTDDKSIIDRIFDFIQEIFREICGKSGIHKDVANEVLNMISDIYLINNSYNIADDRIAMIDKYKNSLNTIGRADILAGFLDDIKDSYKYSAEAISVSKFAHDESSTEEKVEKVSEGNYTKGDTEDDMGWYKKYGFVPRHLGTFMDYAFRKIFAMKGNDDTIIEQIMQITSKDVPGLKDSTLALDLHLDKPTVEAMLSMKKKIVANGGVKAIANSSEMGMVSDFTINGKHLSGVPDLIVVDNNNVIHLVDFKTFMETSTNSIFDINLDDNQNTITRFNSYITQVELYKLMLNEKLEKVCHIVPGEVKIIPYILEMRYKPVTENVNGKNVGTYQFDRLQYVTTRGFARNFIRIEDDGEGNYKMSFVKNENSKLVVNEIYKRSQSFTNKIERNC